MEIKRKNIGIPKDLYDMLELEAKKMAIPVSGLINVAIKEYLKTNSVLQLNELFKIEVENLRKE